MSVTVQFIKTLRARLRAPLSMGTRALFEAPKAGMVELHLTGSDKEARLTYYGAGKRKGEVVTLRSVVFPAHDAAARVVLDMLIEDFPEVAA